jgi:hypothetical protein
MPAARTRSRPDRDYTETEPSTDAYTGMLIISLAATVIGLIFLWLDYSDYAKPLKPIQQVVAPTANPQ